jgi:2-polyprenyl-3-methyl-5-hydroxy-6-metoxy-1,4-benzoquinol methylase
MATEATPRDTGASPIDEARVGAFMERAMGDAAGLMAAVLATLGDRLGLFKTLAGDGSATSAELAARAGVNERYAREWLRGMHAAGYLELDRESGRFTLPAEHAQVLAAEGGPFFLGGAYQVTFGYLRPIERLTEAFRSGGGVPQAAYPAETWEGMARFSRSFYDNLLVQQWVPAVRGLHERLERGARWADVGCGSGLAAIRLAQAFPASSFVGYDSFEGQLELARRAAAEAGVSDRVRFELLDGSTGLPERFDVVSTFDVVHDAVDPPGLVRAIRDALGDDGLYLMLEVNSADDPADNVGPLATLLYGISVVYCMTTSLAHGGDGLGTCGLPEAGVRELCRSAGFSSVERLPIEDPFNALYAVRP